MNDIIAGFITFFALLLITTIIIIVLVSITEQNLREAVRDYFGDIFTNIDNTLASPTSRCEFVDKCIFERTDCLFLP